MNSYKLPEDFELIPYIIENKLDEIIDDLLERYPENIDFQELYDIIDDIKNKHKGTVIEFMFEYMVSDPEEDLITTYYLLLLFYYATHNGENTKYLIKFNELLSKIDNENIVNFVDFITDFRKIMTEIKEMNQDYEYHFIFDRYVIDLIERFNSFLKYLSEENNLEVLNKIANELDVEIESDNDSEYDY